MDFYFVNKCVSYPTWRIEADTLEQARAIYEAGDLNETESEEVEYDALDRILTYGDDLSEQVLWSEPS